MGRRNKHAKSRVKKNRTKPPAKTAAKLLFLSDRTCCVCRGPEKAIQIHHIDENPCNHNLENLAVLCLECHNNTLIQGGFSRKLDAEQVKLFRNKWHKDVVLKRSQLHAETKRGHQNVNLERLQRTLDKTDAIQSGKCRLDNFQKNAALEKLRRTLDKIDAIQSGRSRTNREPKPDVE